MKSLYICLVVFCATIAVPGCGGGSEDTTLATEGLTADDFAQYEADLAAVTAAEDHGAEDEGTEVEGTEDEATEDEATE
jgi:hypothetical protein